MHSQKLFRVGNLFPNLFIYNYKQVNKIFSTIFTCQNLQRIFFLHFLYDSSICRWQLDKRIGKKVTLFFLAQIDSVKKRGLLQIRFSSLPSCDIKSDFAISRLPDLTERFPRTLQFLMQFQIYCDVAFSSWNHIKPF